jgi:flavin reductase (DIM6/NTAB) family NADH-FMN oxidoreductase RutF
MYLSTWRFSKLRLSMPSTNVQPLRRRPADLALSEADARTFQAAIRQLASGVCVVTLGDGDQRTGLTATSVSSLSTEPPTLLVCVNRASATYRAFERFGAFAVNILAADQREFAERFAAGPDLKGEDSYQEGDWRALPNGVCCLADSVAVFDCEVDEKIERHSHAIVIGRVRRVLQGGAAGALVYWRGAYDQIGWRRDEIARAIGLSPGKSAVSV